MLTTELMDLDGAHVAGVAPAPDASRLAVVIACRPENLGETRSAVLARAGHLRSAVATGLTRRRAPEIAFLFAPEGGTHG